VVKIKFFNIKMSKKYFVILGLFLAAGFLFLNLNINSAAAADKYWTGYSSTSSTAFWEPTNWDSGVPSINDNIFLFATTTKTAVISTPVDMGTGKIYVGYNQLGDSAANSSGSFYLLIKEGASLTNRNLFEVGTSSTIWLTSGSLSVGTTTIKQLASTTVSSLTGATSTVTITGDITFGAGAAYSAPANSTTTINGTTQTNTLYSTSTLSFGYLIFGGTGGGTTNLQSNVSVANKLGIAAGRTLDAEGATITLSGSNANSSTFPLEVTGTFTYATSTVTFSGTGATTIASTTYYNLSVTGSATKTLGGNATVTNTATIGSGATLAISTYTMTATGATWTNSGTVTEGTGGKIVKASASQFDDGTGTAKSSFSGDDRNTVYVRVTDTSLNFNASTAETQTVTITAKSMITDTETVTLTETGIATGIFSGGVTFGMSGTNVSGQLDYQGPGTLTFAFTDSQDSSDTGSGSGTFTGTAPGGGSGAAAATTITTTTTTTTTATTATTTTPAVTTTPTATAVPTLESIQTKIASVVAKVAALTKTSPAADIAAVQAEIAAILSDIQAIQAAQPTPQGAALGFNFVRPLALGMRSNDITNLQKALKTDSSVYPEGLVTGYFGPMTLKAVQRFQEKYNIASPGQPGYGNVGPATRAKLNELFGSK
jgi:hypothetical protein